MTQTESAPSSEPENEPDPFSREELGKKDLHSLELLLEISERNLETKILERDKKTKELLALDKEFKEQTRGPDYDMNEDPLMAKCRDAGNKQHELNIDMMKMHDALLPIREAIVKKRHPL